MLPWYLVIVTITSANEDCSCTHHESQPRLEKFYQVVVLLSHSSLFGIYAVGAFMSQSCLVGELRMISSPVRLALFE